VSPGMTVNILVVDDRPENALAIKAVLDDPTYNVVTVSSGAEALRRVLKQEFAVILLDVLMPSMDGFETARLIFEREASRHIPIIFLTALGSDVSSIYRGYRLGAVDYLIKPIEPDIVRAKVAVFVDLFRKTQQIRLQEERLRDAERLRGEAALREREAEYEATFEKAAAGIAHVGIDGRCLRVNQKFCDILGFTRQELLQLRLGDLSHEGDVSGHANAFRHILSGAIESFRGEERFVRKDGRTAWIDLTVSLLREEGGVPKRFIVVVEDATERKHAETRQRALSHVSEALLNSLDLDATLKGLARAAVPDLADYCMVETIDPALPKRPVSVTVAHVDPEQEERLRNLRLGTSAHSEIGFAAVLATREPRLIEGVVSAKLSSADAALLSALDVRSVVTVPLKVRGTIAGAITLLSSAIGRRYGQQDLSLAEELSHRAALGIENARLYREAQDAIGVRDEFLSIASHELRTPLTPLALQLQRLMAAHGSERAAMSHEEVRTMLGRARDQVSRLSRLIDRLLDVSRISSGNLTLEFAAAELSSMAHDVVARFDAQAKDAGCALRLATTGPVVCSCDLLRMDQVLTNLVANAIKYGRGKPIEVALGTDHGSVILSVRDGGIGIPEDKQSIIFERFERATAGGGYGGLGLGLYIARRLVEAHGGAIHVTSKVDEGSTFTVEIPLQRAESVASPTVTHDVATDAPVKSRLPALNTCRSVLLIEDDADIRESIASLLEQEGYRVDTACNGREALDRLEQLGSAPDVILLDLMMPVLDGAGFRSEQEKSPAFAQIPVVVVSGDGNPLPKAKSLGAAGWLKKPFEAGELLAVVDRVCRESSAGPLHGPLH